MITDVVRAGVNRLTGGAGAQPANVAEAIQLMEADVKRMQAMAELDKVENTSQWVNDVRAMQRPVAVALILIVWMGVVFTPSVDEEVLNIVANLASAAVFYLLGDRTYLYFKRKS
jgi:hypothetical protein